MEKKQINGLALVVRLTNYLRTGQAFVSGPLTIQEYIRYSDAHDGKVLYPTYALPAQDQMDDISYMILRCQQTGMCFIGRIAEYGDDYDPATWPKSDPYQVPEPWDKSKARKWLKLDDVQSYDVDVDKCYPINAEKLETLGDMLGKSGLGLPIVSIIGGKASC